MSDFPREWEKIEGDAPSRGLSFRLKIPGGWIVKTCYSSGFNGGASVHTLFISDPFYQWELK